MKNCLICNKQLIKKQKVFCSWNCRSKGNVGKKHPHTAESKEKIRLGHLGNKQSEETKSKIKEKRKFQVLPRGEKHWAYGKSNISIKGERSPLWKGGITPINVQIRCSAEYKNWRKTIFRRDNWTCQFCRQRGGDLQVDHIKPFAYFPELRLELTNGRVLCRDCHRKTETYGRKYKIKYLVKTI